MGGKSDCPYCLETEEILTKCDDNVHVIEIDQMPIHQMQAIQAYCKQLTGASSVPLVFIGRQSVGGYDDIKELSRYRDARLALMIANAKKRQKWGRTVFE